MDWYIMPVLLLLGYFLGYFIELYIKKGEKYTVFGQTLTSFVAEIIYFALLFCVALSKNIPLIFINLILILYARTHTYGREYFEEKPEDRVVTKWYPRFP